MDEPSHEMEQNFDVAEIPDEFKALRACLVCGLVKTLRQVRSCDLAFEAKYFCRLNNDCLCSFTSMAVTIANNFFISKAIQDGCMRYKETSIARYYQTILLTFIIKYC